MSSPPLTQSQMNEVSMFQSVTNMSDEKAAASMLASHEWNLEAAIATALAMQSDNQSLTQSINQSMNPSVSSQSSTQTTSNNRAINPSTNLSISRSASEDASPPSPFHADREPLLQADRPINPASANRSNGQPNNQSLSETINQYPFGWILTGFFDFISTILGLVLPAGWFAGNTPLNQTVNQSRARNRNDSNIAREMAARFTNWPPFIDGTYPQAVRDAKRQSKLLFVYLHDSTTECDRFCSETLATEDMSNFMRENFVGWMGPVNGSDGARLKATLRVTQLPFIALLAPTAGQLAILYRHSGQIAIDNLIHTLLVKLEDHAGLIHAMQAQSQSQSQADQSLQDARSIRQTQDNEYEQALVRDRELAQQRTREEEQAREAARLAAEAAEKERLEKEAEKALAEAEQRAREAKLASIGPEPEPSPTVATVSVRLVDGSKVQRRFDASAKFGQVFNWIESNPSSMNQSAAQPLSIRRARGDEILSPGKHQVVSNFPRAVHSDPDALLSSARLGKQAVLFVEEIIDNDVVT